MDNDDFKKVPARRLERRARTTTTGHTYYVWEDASMPAIHPKFRNCAVYLYPTPTAAKEGKKAGGSGFLVTVMTQEGEAHYVVTNKHVISCPEAPQNESRVVRLNTETGETSTIDLRGEHWFAHPAGDDLAICPVELTSEYQYMCIDTSLFLTLGRMQSHRIGPGDDVFLVGRYVNHEGIQRNEPSVRSGIISQLPGDPIKYPIKPDGQVSFLAELHAIAGFSGSPVFLYPTSQTHSRYGVGLPIPDPWLVGVLWGHLYNEEPIYEKIQSPQPGEPQFIRSETHYVRVNTGMAAMIPAWKLQELLNVEALVRMRTERDATLARQRERLPPQLDSED
jgi:hypothetical protein